MNRVALGYDKDHWIGAACVGESGARVKIDKNMKPTIVTAIGRGNQQMCLVDKIGFPRTKPKSVKRLDGLQTGDIAKVVKTKGKYEGSHVGAIAIRARGDFDVKSRGTIVSGKRHQITLLQRTNGYRFAAPTMTDPRSKGIRSMSTRAIPLRASSSR